MSFICYKCTFYLESDNSVGYFVSGSFCNNLLIRVAPSFVCFVVCINNRYLITTFLASV